MKRLPLSLIFGCLILTLAAMTQTYLTGSKYFGTYYWFKPGVVSGFYYDGHYTLTTTEVVNTGCNGPVIYGVCRKGFTINQINVPAFTLKSGAIASYIIYYGN